MAESGTRIMLGEIKNAIEGFFWDRVWFEGPDHPPFPNDSAEFHDSKARLWG